MKTYMKILKIDKISFRDLIFDEIWEFFEEARETRPFELRSSRRMKSVEIDQRQRQPRNVFWCAILFFATFAIFYAKKKQKVQWRLVVMMKISKNFTDFFMKNHTICKFL